MFTIKDIYLTNPPVHFQKYRKGNLYYDLVLWKNENDVYFNYPHTPEGTFKQVTTEWYEGILVPIEECGDADFNSTDQAKMFVRYISKAIKDKTLSLYRSRTITFREDGKREILVGNFDGIEHVKFVDNG